MSHIFPHILGAAGELLVLIGGLMPLVELMERRKHDNQLWLVHQFVQLSKDSGFVTLEGCRAVFVVPRDQTALLWLTSQSNHVYRRLAFWAARILVLGGACLIAYHWLSLG